MALNKEQVITALRDIDGLPNWAKGPKTKGRNIYEGGDYRGKGSGRFYMDFATFPGGTTDEVPRQVIDELEREGIIRRAFPDKPEINGWTLR